MNLFVGKKDEICLNFIIHEYLFTSGLETNERTFRIEGALVAYNIEGAGIFVNVKKIVHSLKN